MDEDSLEGGRTSCCLFQGLGTCLVSRSIYVSRAHSGRCIHFLLQDWPHSWGSKYVHLHFNWRGEQGLALKIAARGWLWLQSLLPGSPRMVLAPLGRAAWGPWSVWLVCVPHTYPWPAGGLLNVHADDFPPQAPEGWGLRFEWLSCVSHSSQQRQLSPGPCSRSHHSSHIDPCTNPSFPNPPPQGGRGPLFLKHICSSREGFRSFTFNVIIDIVRFIATILLLIFYLSHLFFVSFSFLLSLSLFFLHELYISLVFYFISSVDLIIISPSCNFLVAAPGFKYA